MTDDMTHDLDLLGDWLDAKGYGEEAGLCTRVMDHMHKQDARISELSAALKPFAYDYGDYTDGMWSDLDYIQVTVGDLRAARKLVEGKDD